MTPTTWPYCATFPISGAIIRPTATDYRLEAALMRIEARKFYRPRPQSQVARYHWLMERARIFTRLARRKAWAEEMAAHRLAHREAA